MTGNTAYLNIKPAIFIAAFVLLASGCASARRDFHHTVKDQREEIEILEEEIRVLVCNLERLDLDLADARDGRARIKIRTSGQSYTVESQMRELELTIATLESAKKKLVAQFDRAERKYGVRRDPF